jgi:hypothetical protein
MKGALFAFLFFSLALATQSQNLWMDEDRRPIPTFKNDGIAPNTIVNIYKSDMVMHGIFDSGASEDELYATIRFDERSRPAEVKVKPADEDFHYYKTVFQYESDDTFSASLFKGERDLLHKWFVVDSLLVEELSFPGGVFQYRWTYRTAEDGTTYDEKFKRNDKLIRVAIMKTDSLDNDGRYCVWKRDQLIKMSLYRTNEEGNPKRVELLDTDDLKAAAKKLNIERNDLSEFDAERIRMALIGLTYYWNFEYDDKNDLLKQSLFNQHSEEVGMVRYERDENGNIESVIADADIASKIPWYEFYEDLSGLSKTKSVYYYQGLELLNVKSHTLYDLEGRPVEAIFEYVGYNVGGGREKYRYEYIYD